MHFNLENSIFFNYYIFSYSCFSIDDVHRIAILDLRILNCDRNDENILV